MFRSLAIVLAMGCLGGCKKLDASRIKSLDNFAAGQRVRTNVCSGNPALVSDPGLQGLLQEVDRRIIDKDSDGVLREKNKIAVRNAFSALPPFSQTQFLGLGGQILLTKDANRFCTSSKIEGAKRLKRSEQELAYLREGYSDVKACFVFANGSELLREGFSGDAPLHFLILSNEPVEISHNFVRVFGYMNSQLSSRLSVTGNFISSSSQAVLAAESNPRFGEARKEIADAFLADITDRPEAKRFAKLANLKGNSPGRIVFEDFVYAEAFDSYFCNQYADGDKNTLKVMGREFPKTLVAFSKSLDQQTKRFSLAEGALLSLWSPFGWVSNTYNSYVEKRDAMIEGMVRNVMETNGGKPPGFIDTISIAANGALRPAADVPIVDSVLKPAVKYADAYTGATINESGNGQILTDAQRIRLAASGTADIGLNIAGGMAAEAAGKKIGAIGAEKLGDVIFETGAGRRVVEGIVENVPSVGRVVFKYGAKATEEVVGGASNQVIENFVAAPTADVISGTIAGAQASSSGKEE